MAYSTQTLVKVTDNLEVADHLAGLLYGNNAKLTVASEMKVLSNSIVKIKTNSSGSTGGGINIYHIENSNFNWSELMLRHIPNDQVEEIKMDVERSLNGVSIYTSENECHVIVGWCQNGMILTNAPYASGSKGILNRNYSIDDIHYINETLIDEDSQLFVKDLNDDRFLFTLEGETDIENWFNAEIERRLEIIKNQKVSSKKSVLKNTNDAFDKAFDEYLNGQQTNDSFPKEEIIQEKETIKEEKTIVFNNRLLLA